MIKRYCILWAFLPFFIFGTAFSEERRTHIGVITPLTGGMATIGGAVKNGIELARRDRPELFRGVDFSYQDDQFDPKQSIIAYNNLRIQSKADVIFGFGTLVAQVVGPLAERDRVPLINFNFEAAPAVGNRFLIRSLNHTDQYMEAVAVYLRSKGLSSIPLVQTEASFFNAMVNGLAHSLPKEISLKEIARVTPSESDFRMIITKLKRERAPVVGLFLWPEQLLSFAKQARELGFSSEFIGTDLCESASMLRAQDAFLAGCLYPDNSASESFRTEYAAVFGNESQLTFAASAYDMTVLLGELLSHRRGGDPAFDSAALLTALRGVRHRSGVLGTFSFQDSAQFGQFFEYPILLKRIRGNRGVAVPQEPPTN